MKIPEKLRVAGVDYKVEWKPFVELDGRLCYGVHDGEKSAILMEEGDRTDFQSKCQTFLHEMLHAIEKQYSVPLPHGKREKIIDRLATGLYQVLQDNSGAMFGNSSE